MKRHQYDLAICAIFQNEAPFLLEWLEFHRMLGVQHFWLYNNNSVDSYQRVLHPYVRNRIVTLYDWPTASSTPITAYQEKAYDHCLAAALGKTKWLAFIDLDEYIVPTENHRITDFLRSYEDFAAVFLYWQMFGTSGLRDLPAGKIMIEALLRRAETDYRGNLDGKTICRPELVTSMTVHEARFVAGSFAVDAQKRRHPAGSIVTSPARIHHYFTRAERHMRENKIPRRTRVEGRQIPEAEIQRHLAKLNQVEDHTALQYVPALRRRMTAAAQPKTPAQDFVGTGAGAASFNRTRAG
jgi:hypothetical protein